MAVGVVEVGCSVDLSEQLVTRGGELLAGLRDVVDAEADREAVVVAVGRCGARCVDLLQVPVGKGEDRGSVHLHRWLDAEAFDREGLVGLELVGLHDDGVPGDPVAVHVRSSRPAPLGGVDVVGAMCRLLVAAG